jgi:hypothetical protein
MSNNNFFDDAASELDMLEEAQELIDYEEEPYGDSDEPEQYDENSNTEYSSDQHMEDMLEEVASKKPSYSLNRQEKSVVSEAMLRLEQARLYEMLLKHNFFEGVRTGPAAKQNVEQELKKFILDRLEVLLGIKAEASNQTAPSEFTFELPFNEVEVEFLKALAYKGTNGASVTAQSSQAQVQAQSVPQAPQQLPKLRQEGLKPLSQSKPVPRPQPVQQQRQPVKQLAKPAPRPQAPQQPQRQPVKQQVKAPAPKKKARSLDEIAREDIEAMKNRKPAHKMSAKELIAANKKIEGGGSRARPANALPMPTPEQQITSIVTAKAANSGKGGPGLNDILSKALGAIPLETVVDD